MRGLVQRVKRAEVRVDGEVVGAIGAGLCVCVGVTHDDGDAEADRLAAKLAGLRILDDDAGVMNRSVVEAGGEVLLVSQFTLYGDTAKGRRPTWNAAAPPEQAKPLLDRVAEGLSATGLSVTTGRFGEYMVVELGNDGPATLMVEV